MEKDFLKDVTPPAHKRSIRDIPIPVSRKGVETGNAINLKRVKIKSVTEDTVGGSENDYYNQFVAAQNPKTRSTSRKILIPIFLILVIGVIFGALNVFASATITIQAKKASSDINQEIPVVDIASVENENQLAFRNIEFSKEVSAELNASGEEYVSKKSTGTITIYNNYTSKKQDLIKNTRFQSTEGKIYRIDKLVTIPGYTMSGTKKIPGQIVATVVADETGESFNVGKTKFTIPGFKGQEQFTTLYAESKTDMIGGFEGNRKVISEEEMRSTTDKLNSDLRTALIEEVKNQLPSNLIPIYDDSSFTINPIIKKDINDKKVNVVLSGKIIVKVVDKNKLSQKIAEYVVPDYKTGEKVLLNDFTTLSITTSDNTISVSGKADIVWQIDSEEIKKSTAGIEQNQLQSVFTKFTGVQKIETKFSPSWKTTFPENADRISVVVN